MVSKKRAFVMAAAAALSAVSIASPARADITITTCQSCQQGSVVQFDQIDAVRDGTVYGSVMQDGITYLVKFSSLTGQNLITPSNGAARIIAEGDLLRSLFISMADASLTFDSIEFKLSGQPDGMLTLVAYDQNGTQFSRTFNLTELNGADWFSATTDASQSIRSIEFSGNVGFNDIRSIRLGAIASTIPEPATWGLMILGFGLAGSAMRRRRSVVQRVFA